jgi:hypothetical protein
MGNRFIFLNGMEILAFRMRGKSPGLGMMRFLIMQKYMAAEDPHPCNYMVGEE